MFGNDRGGHNRFSMEAIMKTLSTMFAASLIAMLFAGCSTSPNNPEAKADLISDSSTELHRLTNQDPGLNDFLNRAYGYAIFPNVGKADSSPAPRTVAVWSMNKAR